MLLRGIEMSVSQIFFISCCKIWVKIITEMVFKEKHVVGVDGETQMIQSVSIRFLVLSVPWSSKFYSGIN